MNYMPIAFVILAIIFVVAIILNGYVKVPSSDFDNKRLFAALALFGVAVLISVWLLVKK